MERASSLLLPIQLLTPESAASKESGGLFLFTVVNAAALHARCPAKGDSGAILFFGGSSFEWDSVLRCF